MKNIIGFVLLNIVISCSAQNSTYNPKSIDLNNKSIDLIAKSYGVDTLLKEALVMLNNAIKLDTSYYIAYQSKAIVLCKLKKYDSAIITLDNVLKLKKNTAEVLSTQGFILEKVGKKSEATIKYKAAFIEYERLIKEQPNKVEYQVNKAFLLVFLANKEAANKSLKEILQKYPKNKSAEATLSILDIFDRNQYIETYGQ